MPHTSLSELAKRFLANEPSYVSSDYLESDARSEFIDPLLAHLGWDMENRSGLAPLLREVLREETLPTETKGPKRPDYTFRINGVRRLHAEAKRPGVDIVKDSYSAFQCRSYGWSAGHPVSVLTNFRTTSVYDTTIQPHAGDDPDVALIARVPVGHLVDRLNDLSKHVGREAIKQGYILASKTPIPVNSQFLAKIKSWRILLAQDLRNRHPQLPLNDCNDISQKLINRIIFIRMCEDRDIEQHDTLKNCNSEDSYDGLLRLFVRLDNRYNAGLFSVADDALRNGIHLSPSVLSNMILDVLAPKSPYSFAVLDAAFLGQVYDSFLCERLCITDDGSIGIELKPVYEGRDAIPTPQPVVDAVVKRTISSLISSIPLNEGESLGIDHILRLKILDFAVGSGRFVLSVFNELCAASLDVLTRSGQTNRLLAMSDNTYALSFEMKREIATNCLWGIDIDFNAVEIAKFTLLVRLLEDENGNTLPFGNSILPNVDKNIVWGNSIVDAGDFVGIDTAQPTLPLDWAAHGLPLSFDAVVGNPPYMQTKDMRRLNPQEYAYLKGRIRNRPRYSSSHKQFDKYFIFVERALAKTRNLGWCGFVIPNKWINVESAKGLRTVIRENNCAIDVVDFGSKQLFDGRDTYVCILVLNKGREDCVRYHLVSDPDAFFLGDDASHFENGIGSIEDGPIGSPWLLAGSQIERSVIDTMISSPIRLSDVASINNGIQTSAEEVYSFLPLRQSGDCYLFGDPNDPIKIECALTRPYLKDSESGVKLFHPISTKHRVIYPYEMHDGHIRVIPPDRMASDFPNAFTYLNNHIERLQERDVSPPPPDGVFYSYGRHQALETSSACPKIIYSVNQRGNKYGLDVDGVIFASGGTAGEVSINLNQGVCYTYNFLIGLLSYPLTEFFLRKRGSSFRGGFYARGSAVIGCLPLPCLDNAPAHMAANLAISNTVTELMNIHADIHTMFGRSRARALIEIRQKKELIFSNLDSIWGVAADTRNRIILPGG